LDTVRVPEHRPGHLWPYDGCPAHYHQDTSDKGQSQAELYVHFDELTQVKTVEEIEIIEEDINKANPDIMGALDEYINADEQAEKDGEKPQNA
jgi:hypothetical protein